MTSLWKKLFTTRDARIEHDIRIQKDLNRHERVLNELEDDVKGLSLRLDTIVDLMTSMQGQIGNLRKDLDSFMGHALDTITPNYNNLVDAHEEHTDHLARHADRLHDHAKLIGELEEWRKYVDKCLELLANHMTEVLNKKPRTRKKP